MMPDVIIVGQGICGSLFSWSLIQKGLSVKIYDRGTEHSATYAASGIINPITGKRFVKSWMTDDLLPAADRIYSTLSQKLSIDLYHKLPIYKLLESVKEQNDLSARASEPGYENYFTKSDIHALDRGKIRNDFGSFVINGGGKLNTISFLKNYRIFLQANDILVEEDYSYEQSVKAETKVIFCDGYKAAQTGLFTSLPWQIVKGEYLRIRIKDFYTDRIISGDTTISPAAEPDMYYAGATYQWHYETVAPTAQYRNEIIESLGKVLSVPYEVIHHGAGIRPSAKYRRPFIGFHPEYKNVGIFNGMGTKGISLAPYFSEHFAEHIVEGKELMGEVDIRHILADRKSTNP